MRMMIEDDDDNCNTNTTPSCIQKHHSLTRSIGKQIKEKFSYKSKLKGISHSQSQIDGQTINWEKFSDSNSVFGAKLKVKMPLNYKEMIGT